MVMVICLTYDHERLLHDTVFKDDLAYFYAISTISITQTWYFKDIISILKPLLVEFTFAIKRFWDE